MSGVLAGFVDSELLDTLFASLGAGVYATDRVGDGGGVVVAANPQCIAMLGYPLEELMGASIHDLVHYARPDGSPLPAADCPMFAVSTSGAVDTGWDVFWHRDGSPVPIAWASAPLRHHGEVVGTVVVFTDDRARQELLRRAQQAQAQLGMLAARLQLLATVSAELTTTFEVEATVARFAQLLVPQLADWATVTLIDAAGTMRDVGWWHHDQPLRAAVAAFARGRFDGTDLDSTALLRAVSRRRPVPVGPAELGWGDGAPESAGAVALAELAPSSAVLLPLIGRGEVFGVLTLARGADRSAMTPEDLSTAEQVAGRAGLALHNARLYDEQRDLAEALQLSLLTDPAQPAGGAIAVRYRPAARAASVGGDWFDAFPHPAGATLLVIGDVVGHDTEAAAAMGQLRGLLRGVAWGSPGPAATLSTVDAAVLGLDIAVTASAVVAWLDAPRADGTVRLRWSNAGHPPPLVLDATGRVTVLEQAEADLLLGVDPQTSRADAELVLGRGSTLLLYTDGLIERRGQDLGKGLETLYTALAACGGLGPQELCDALLTRLRPDRADDDVAVLALRIDD